MNKINTFASQVTCLILDFLTIWELSILDQAICETKLRLYFLNLVESHAIQYKAPVHINKMRYPKLFVRWVRRIGLKITILCVEELNDLYFEIQEMTEEQIRNKIDVLRDDGFYIDQATVENFDFDDFHDSLLHDKIAESEIVDVLTILNDCGSLKLEALSLRSSPLKTASFLKLSPLFDHLQKLCLSRCDIQLLEHIVEIPSFGLLRFLDLNNIYTSDDNFDDREYFDRVVAKIAECCTKLQYLFLDGASITDIALFALSKGFCQLIELSLRNCDKVTYIGLEELVKGCPTLRKLDIGGAIKTAGYVETIIMRTLAGSQIEQFNFYMGQFKQLEECNEVDMSMNFSEYFKNPHESVMNFLKIESRDEREAMMSSVFIQPKH